jgi:hypothetical protein
MRIYISGVHSGPNPSPGVGIARSLRAAFPYTSLVAVDYSAASSGLLWEDFDDCLVRPPWQAIDLRSHVSFVASVLAQGALWLSGLDLEVQLLARRLRADRRLPCPPASAVALARKPPVAIGKRLGLAIPPFLPCAPASDQQLSHFCRTHGWPIWVKGTTYEAVPIWSWYEMAPVLSRMAGAWGGRDQVFVQTHVDGQDVTIAFAAWRGTLLGAAFLEKLDRTHEGKAWSGRVGPVPGDIERRLRAFVRATRWSGGGEIECVRDPLSRLWLLECNARFPAWIYGATLAGYNLPARLIEAVTGERGLHGNAPGSRTFTRVVVEVQACG